MTLLLPLFAQTASAQSSMPFNHYLTAIKSPSGDPRVSTFAHTCLGPAAAKSHREFFYTEGDWVHTPDLHATLAGYTTGDADTAEVWFAGSTPRAVYLWEVDLEYQRDSLFCLDSSGTVTKAISRFFPSASGEPREHWVYIRATHPGPGDNTWVSVGRYEDAHGKKLSDPDLSAEDKDFIRGEREYHYWNDFDFAKLAGDSGCPTCAKHMWGVTPDALSTPHICCAHVGHPLQAAAGATQPALERK